MVYAPAPLKERIMTFMCNTEMIIHFRFKQKRFKGEHYWHSDRTAVKDFSTRNHTIFLLETIN